MAALRTAQLEKSTLSLLFFCCSRIGIQLTSKRPPRDFMILNSTNCFLRIAKTQLNLGIHPTRPECVKWAAKGLRFLHLDSLFGLKPKSLELSSSGSNMFCLLNDLLHNHKAWGFQSDEYTGVKLGHMKNALVDVLNNAMYTTS